MHTYPPFNPYSNSGCGCHGCGGKGWVSPSYGIATVCPICNGTGAAQLKYTVKISDHSEKVGERE